MCNCYIWSLPAFLTILMISSLEGSVIKDREEILECFPEKPGNFSSKGAEAVIYDIVDEDKQDGAAIFCSITGKVDRYVKMELTLYGEPPNHLSLEAFSDTLLQLEKSLIYCCTKDIFERNRRIDLKLTEDLERYHLNMTGVVRYKCDGMPRLSIDLAGLELISKDLSKSVHNIDRRDAEETKEICVIEGEIMGSTSRLGKHCSCISGGCIEMYDEKGHFTCAKCCAGSYWRLNESDIEHVKGVCSKCGPHYTNTRSNTRTGCSKKRNDHIPVKTTSKPQTTPPLSKPPTIKPSGELPTDTTKEKRERSSTVLPSTQASTMKPTQPLETKPTTEKENDDVTSTATPPEHILGWNVVGLLGGLGYVGLFILCVAIIIAVVWYCERKGQPVNNPLLN